MSKREYFNLSIPAPQRLAMMRAQGLAQCGRNWRNIRGTNFRNWREYFGMLMVCPEGWYTHSGPEFRDERFAHEIVDMRHTGWFTNHDGITSRDGSGLARGIVARLPHGRFIAGYWWGDNGERVYYPEIFDDEDSAALAADSHAESFAESCRDDSERFDAMQDAESHAESVADDVGMAFQARNVSARHREYCRDRIEELKRARKDLQAARAFFASAWAESEEKAGQVKGGEIMARMPEEIDPAAMRAAETLRFDMERANGENIAELLRLVESIGDGDRPNTAEIFGHYCAMQAMGHGVGLLDAFGSEVYEKILIPRCEFGAHSLSRDYF